MARLRRRGLCRAALATATALLAAACTGSVLPGQGHTSSQGSVSSSAPHQPLANFHDCSSAVNMGALGLPAGRAAKLSFDCTTISVPLDYAHPDGRQIGIVLFRIHDSDNHGHLGSLIVNPGGPGGSGVDFVLSLAGRVSDRILSNFDLVGFDPRGVNLSSPVRCLTNAEKDDINAASPDVLTAAGFAQARQIAQEFAQKCEAKYGSSLAQYDTVATAKDMDQIRQAVGDPKMNYLGFSYGTELGAQYIHLFPHNVRVAVLDGAVDPLTGPIVTFANQIKGFELAFDQFASWCAKNSSCSTLGNPRQAVYQIAAQARQAPIPSSEPGETRKATSSLVYTGVLSALYSQSQWGQLGQALIEARNGDSKGLLQLADQYLERYNGQYTNLTDANTAINCNDSTRGPSDATIRATAASWAKRFPMFGLWSAASLFSCQVWQPDRTVPPLPTAPNTPDKVLVIGNIHDPATPYQGAKDLTNTLGNAELLTWDGEGHTSYLEGSSCVDQYVENYLISEDLPPAGTTCPP